MAGDYVPGEMNIDDQQATYTGFIAASVWGGTLVSLAVLLLTLVFAAGQPFMGSLFGVAFLGVVAGLMFRMGTAWYITLVILTVISLIAGGIAALFS
jgi:hypothetical protein